MDDYRKGFEAALAQDRYDSTTRLVFADWLEEQGLDDEAAEQRHMARPEWVSADKFLRAYAVRMNPYDIEDYDWREKKTIIHENGAEKAFARLIEGLRTGELLAWGTDLHGLSELDDADELRQHASFYLRTEIDWSNFTFSCSC